MEFTRRRNLNRGFMKLKVWQESMELFRIVHKLTESIPTLDLRLRSQLLDAAQSMSSNIAEGCCRRTVREYIQFIAIAMGSAGELMTRVAGLRTIQKISEAQFEEFDRCHYSVENKLIQLRRALEAKKRTGDWKEEV